MPAHYAAARAILDLADAYLTNTDLHARRLRQLAPDRRPAAVLPVLSNIGEPGELQCLEAREPLAAVFGQPGMRARVYRHFEAFLPALRAAGIERILDIGPPLDRRATDEPPLPVTRCGYLAPALASAAMLRARFGLLDYPLQLAISEVEPQVRNEANTQVVGLASDSGFIDVRVFRDCDRRITEVIP